MHTVYFDSETGIRTFLETVSSFVLPKEETVSNFRRRKDALRRLSCDLSVLCAVRYAVLSERRIDFPRPPDTSRPRRVQGGTVYVVRSCKTAPFAKGSRFLGFLSQSLINGCIIRIRTSNSVSYCAEKKNALEAVAPKAFSLFGSLKPFFSFKKREKWCQFAPSAVAFSSAAFFAAAARSAAAFCAALNFSFSSGVGIGSMAFLGHALAHRPQLTHFV